MSAKHKKSGMKKVSVPHSHGDSLVVERAERGVVTGGVAERVSGVGSPVGTMEQRDRSLTVMIPRAKYRAAPACPAAAPLSTFTGEQDDAKQREHKLLAYLDSPSPVPQPVHQAVPQSRKQSGASGNSAPPPPPPAHRKGPAPRKPSSTGALVSAGFEVSATVVRRSVDVDDDASSRDDASSHHRHYHADHGHTLRSHHSQFDTQRTRVGDR